MQNRSIIRFSMMFFALCTGFTAYARKSVEDAMADLQAGLGKSANSVSNFPSMQLFSVADMKQKTYNVLQSKSLCLTRSASYAPKTELVGSPAIHVKASTVIIDLNGQILSKFADADREVRCVGIELGYSKKAIDDDANLTLADQPTQLIVRNGTLDNFDIGFVIHEGVKHVRLENITFTNCPVGIVMMGSSDAYAEVASVVCENVKIVGNHLDDHSAVEWAISKIESNADATKFGYGSGSFADETNPVTNSVTDMYAGVVMRYVHNVLLESVEVDSFGYAPSNEAAITRGFNAVNCHNLFLNNCRASHMVSAADVVGCRVKSSTSVAIKNSEFNNNAATRGSVNITATGSRRAIGVHLQSVDAVQLANVECNKNSANSADDTTGATRTFAAGIYVQTANALDLDNVVCTNNAGNAGTAAGMHFDTTVSLKAHKLFADYNSATAACRGIYLSTSAVTSALEEVSANGNTGGVVTGIEVVAANGCTFKNVKANYSNGTGAVTGIKFTTSAQSVLVDGASATSTTSSNGAVTGFAMASANGVTVKNAAVDYSNSSANNAAATGFDFTGSANALQLENISAVSVDAHGSGAAIGLAIAAGQSIMAKNVLCNYVNSTSGAVTAVSLTGATQDVTFNGLQASNLATSGAIVALNFAGASEAIVVRDFYASSNTSSAGAVQGVHFADTANSVIFDKGALDSNATTGAALDGFAFDGAAANVTVKNMSCSNCSTSTSGALTPFNFASTVNGLVFEGVVVHKNTSAGALIAYNCASTANAITMNKVACDANSATGAFTGFGFGAATSVRMADISVNANSSSAALKAINFSSTVGSWDVKRATINGNSAAAASQMVVSAGAATSVTFDDVLVQSNSSSVGALHGIKLESPSNVSLQHVSVSNNSASEASNSADMKAIEYATAANSVELIDVLVNKNSSAQGAVRGITIASGKNVNMRDCSISDNVHTGSASAALRAVEFSSSVESLDMQNVVINNNKSLNAQAIHGLYIAAGVAVNMDHVTVNNTKATGAAAAVGIEFASSAKSVTMNNVGIEYTNSTAGNASGLVVASPISMKMYDVVSNYATGTGNVYGMQFTSSAKALDILGGSCNANISSSSGTAYGLSVAAGVAVRVENVSADYNVAAGSNNEAVGMDFASSVSALTLKNVSANNNVSGGGAVVGIRMAAANAVSMDGVACNYNLAAAAKEARGIHATSSFTSAHMKHISCDSNAQVSASAGGTTGITYGIHLVSPQSVVMSDVTASKNLGDIKAHGIFLDGTSATGTNVEIRDALFNGNQSRNSDVIMTGKNTTAHASKHFAVPNHVEGGNDQCVVQGAFGVYAYDVDSCTFTNVDASKNSGARAGGMYFAESEDTALYGCKTSYQTANGTFFEDDIATDLTTSNIAAVSIPDAQASTIYQDANAAKAVDVLTTTKAFLAALRELKYLFDIANYDVAETTTYTQIAKLVSSQELLHVVMAQFRRFSTAVGLQFHNCSDCVVEDHLAVGNTSAKDNAIGIGMSGLTNDMLVFQSKSSGNKAWTDSERTATSCDVSAVHPFWTALSTKVLSTSGGNSNQSTAIAGVVAANMVTYIGYTPNASNLPEGNSVWSMDEDNLLTLDNPDEADFGNGSSWIDRLAIVFNSGSATDLRYEEFGPAVGGLAAGYVVGDGAVNVEIISCDAVGNQGHAGKAFGILQDVTTSMTAKDNKLLNMYTNDFGYSFGLADITLQSNSLHAGNVMYGNSVGDCSNFNFLVPYNPAAHPNIYFPHKLAYNGDFTQFANLAPLDNMVIDYVSARQADAYAPTGMLASQWVENSWIVNEPVV